jgi:DNA mismatch endonuclease, patch repair protein
MDIFTKEQRHIIMSHVHSKDTQPEVVLRKALWHLGVRYRKNYKKLPGSPDIVLTKYHIAIFVDGDFWHGKGHFAHPGEQIKCNKEFWRKKLKRNIERDKDVNAELSEMGWLVLRFWESDVKKRLDWCVQTVLASLPPK